MFLRSARYPRVPRFLQFLREFWPRPLPLMNHSALALIAQRTRVPTSARNTGFCVIWVCISSSSSSRSKSILRGPRRRRFLSLGEHWCCLTANCTQRCWFDWILDCDIGFHSQQRLYRHWIDGLQLCQFPCPVLIREDSDIWNITVHHDQKARKRPGWVYSHCAIRFYNAKR